MFSNGFYTNAVPTHCHTLLVGEAFINGGKVKETYFKYDAKGNLTETKVLFPTRDYSVFSDVFTEPGQTSFTIDLTGLTITNGILVISAIPVPTIETLYETHSEPGKGWHNTGTWNGNSFYADYTQCYSVPEPDCFDGETEIGPFDHCPGSPNYTGYTTWVEDNHMQYVQTNYTAIVNEYPAKVEYELNSTSWTTITNSLGAGTTSITIPADNFIQGVNTLQFRDSNSYSTKFSWVLYIDQGATPQQYTTVLAYDIYGNVISITDALNDTTLLGYDTQYHAYLSSITNALNHTISATYDLSRGLVTSITDARGNTTSFEYDILGRVTKKINPDQTEKKAVYNDQDNYVTIYDELYHSRIRYYDGIGRLTKIEWYLSPTTKLTETYTYNYMNKVETKTDSEGHLYSREYDSRGRPTKVMNPDSTYREILYDDISNTISVFDENGHKKEYHYDWANQLMWVKEYIGTTPLTTQYTYDSAGNLTSLTDANGNTTFFSYDSVFGVTQVTYTDSTTEEYVYDAVGNVQQKREGTTTTTFTYDSVRQLVHILWPDQSVTLTYDANGNRTSMTDSEGTSTYTYDTRNRLLTETRTIAGELYTVSYQYDAASNITSMVYPDGSGVTYEYDSLNRVTGIPGYAEYTFTSSLLTHMTYSNGVVTTYGYDSCDRPLTLHAQKDSTDLLSIQYQYDPVGNMQHMVYGRRLPDQQWAQSVETYQYDTLDRLVSAQGDYGLLQYSYDAVGNRISQNDLTYTYNNMNELVSLSNGTTFTYDDRGNTLTKTDGIDMWLYTYDTQNQLTQLEKNMNVIAQFHYDGDGYRVRKTEWVESAQEYQTTIYVYSGINVIYEKNVTTGAYATYVYGFAGRIAKRVNGLQDCYITDHLGTTRLITDESGNTATSVTYTPFGESVLEGEEDSHLYTGKELDQSGLYYYGARYYDPEIGRFITRDRQLGYLQIPATLNRYVYCINNPLKYIDPDGQEIWNPTMLDKPTERSSFLWGYIYYLVWRFKCNSQGCVDYYDWANSHSLLGQWAGFGVSSAGGVGGFLIGGWVGLGIGLLPGLLLVLMYTAADLWFADMWHDPQFVELWNEMEKYSIMMAEGYSCEQELSDAICMLLVYIYQKKYGDKWRDYAPKDLVDYYDDMQERKSQTNSPSQDPSSSTSPPPTPTPPPRCPRRSAMRI